MFAPFARANFGQTHTKLVCPLGTFLKSADLFTFFFDRNQTEIFINDWIEWQWRYYVSIKKWQMEGYCQQWEEPWKFNVFFMFEPWANLGQTFAFFVCPGNRKKQICRRFARLPKNLPNCKSVHSNEFFWNTFIHYQIAQSCPAFSNFSKILLHKISRTFLMHSEDLPAIFSPIFIEIFGLMFSVQWT